MLIIERHLPSIFTFTDLPYHPTCGSAHGGFVLSHLTMCGKLLSAIPLNTSIVILPLSCPIRPIHCTLVEFYDFVATLDKDVSGFLTSSPATAIDRQHLAHRKYGEGIRLEVIFEYVDVDRVFDMARLKLLCRTNIQAHYGGIGYQFLESIR